MINFPNDPAPGQQYTYAGRTWQWSPGTGGARGKWLLVPVSSTDAEYAATKAAEAKAYRDAAEWTVAAAEAARDQAQVYAGESLTYREQSQHYADVAFGHAQDAEDSAQAAAQSAVEAADAVLAAEITGLDTSNDEPITATDRVLDAFGKLQAQITSLLAAIGLLAPKDSPTFTGTVSGITKEMVGLGNVDNTADLDKPISTATQAALDLKAPLESPALTGTPTAPTPESSDNTTKIATTEFVKAQGYLTSAPVTSVAGKTGEVALDKDDVGLGNVDNTADIDKPISTATQAALDLKAPLESPTLTGTPTAPTPDAADDSTKIATTAFVKAQGYLTSAPVTSVAGRTGEVTLTKDDVGLGNVDNTADIDKPVSTAQAAAINSVRTTLEVNTQTGTDYTLALSDAGKRVSMNNANPNTVTIPLDEDVAFPDNTVIYVSQDGSGATEIAGDTGVTINTAEGLMVGGQYRMVTLIKTGADTWLAVGTVA